MAGKLKVNHRQVIKNKNGLTMIELVIALSMAVALVTSVYFFWNFLNKHTNVHTKNALFTVEVNRITQSIANQIRNSTAITSYDESSISFVSQKNDSMKYSFDGDSLYCNDTAITLVNKGSRITSFLITNINEDEYREAAHALFEIKLTMENYQGDTSTVALTIRTPKPQLNNNNW